MKVLPLRRERREPEWFAGYGDLMTASEVAQVVQQSPQTVRRLMATGQLPACRIGTRWYTPKTRLVEFVERGIDGAA